MARESRSPHQSAPAPKPKAVKVYLTEEEKQEALERAGPLSLSEYFRRAGLGKRALSPPVPAINRETYLLLATISESLQEMARSGSHDLTLFDALQQLLDQVRGQLIALEEPEP